MKLGPRAKTLGEPLFLWGAPSRQSTEHAQACQPSANLPANDANLSGVLLDSDLARGVTVAVRP